MQYSQDPINTLENLIFKNKTKSISIYLVLLLAILIFLALLPVIKIDISSQSRGIVRSTTDNVPVTSLVNGKVTFVNLKNNSIVQKGDTLVQLTQENLDTEKATNQEAREVEGGSWLSRQWDAAKQFVVDLLVDHALTNH